MTDFSGFDLVYKGDGSYDLIAGPFSIELSYEGSDYMVGEWQAWDVRIGTQSIASGGLLGDGEFVDWLEAQVRKSGHLPEEP